MVVWRVVADAGVASDAVGDAVEAQRQREGVKKEDNVKFDALG